MKKKDWDLATPLVETCHCKRAGGRTFQTSVFQKLGKRKRALKELSAVFSTRAVGWYIANPLEAELPADPVGVQSTGFCEINKTFT